MSLMLLTYCRYMFNFNIFERFLFSVFNAENFGDMCVYDLEDEWNCFGSAKNHWNWELRKTVVL